MQFKTKKLKEKLRDEFLPPKRMKSVRYKEWLKKEEHSKRKMQWRRHLLFVKLSSLRFKAPFYKPQVQFETISIKSRK